MEELLGVLERVTFQSQESGFLVGQLKVATFRDLVPIVGHFSAVQPGETLRCFGKWQVHSAHGRQFAVARYEIEAPATLLGIRKYLGSGLVKGIGPKFAARIVDKFGLETLDILEKEPHRILEIPGFGQKKLDRMVGCWKEQREIRQLMVFLQAQDVSPAVAHKIFRCYGAESIAKIRVNPYSLATDVHGIGFKTADRIAAKLGVKKEDPQRVDAGIEFSLFTLSSEGHTCYPLDTFFEEASSILTVSQELVKSRVVALEAEGRVVLRDHALEGHTTTIWSRPFYQTEIGVAKELHRLQGGGTHLRAVDAKRAVAWVQEELSIQLAEQQKQAVEWAIHHKLLIVTGGPGTGKSTLVHSILKIFGYLTPRIVLAAPTGRAAKRMSEVTGHAASTIHALLEYDFQKGGFKKNRENPLVCDLLIVDEASMLDLSLMYSLLKALPEQARLILVGDVHQLPSVGPGSVLKDLIACQRFPVVSLTQIFRQAAGSSIIQNAHRIQQGKLPAFQSAPTSDFFFLEEKEPEKLAQLLLELVRERLPRRYGFDPMKDIQLLSPMRRGIVGTDQLNRLLQEALNPQEWGLVRGGERFQLQDKVMQIRNNYQKVVFNGDIGFVVALDPEEQQLVVAFEGKEVVYEFHELDELTLAYAISVHKFQGSESPCVLFPVHTTHYMLLQRNLVYTALTRGKKTVVMAGEKRAVAMAVQRLDGLSRYTQLKEAVCQVISEKSDDGLPR